MEPYQRKGPLTGIKIADFTWVGAGPQVPREMANMGAQVIRIENHKYPCSLRLGQPFRDNIPGINRSMFGACYNTSKYSVCIRLDKPKGREAAKKLIMWADVMAQSMTSDAMIKWGFGYDDVVKFKPDIIYYSTNQPGLIGPYRTFGGYGNHGGAIAGWEMVTGYPDLYPVQVPSAYTDFISPWYGATALLAALAYKRRTGKGLLLDQCQWEAGANNQGPAILDYIVNGRVATPVGNRDPDFAPQGVFRCRGADRWVAIGVESDAQWQAFCRVVNEEWVRNPQFATLLGRKENEDELEKLINVWTANQLAEELMRMLQDAGVPAGVTQTNQDIIDHDPQVKHRKAYEWPVHQEIGPALHNTPAYRMSKTPHHILKAGPCIGQDNEYVYKEVLGYTDDDIAEFYAEGVIDTEYDAPAAVRPKS